MADQQIDILIIGGGLTGATLMLALNNLGYKTLLVEAKPFSKQIHTDFDARSLALAPASVCILQMLKIWPHLQQYATSIETIHVSEQGAFGNARLYGEKQQSLGYVVEMQHINKVLHQLINEQCILAPAELTALNASNSLATIRNAAGNEVTLQAKLIVAADGADSSVRRLCGLSTKIKDYHQHAIVANIGLTRSHRNIAYERFTPTGPLALLPMTELRSSLVWSLSPQNAQSVIEMNDQKFLQALQKAFGYRLGRFMKAGKRTLYPLRQVIMTRSVLENVVFVGNAAHTLHPVAGQGFNLGLRDVATLAQCIAQEGLCDKMLDTYQAARAYDQTAIIRFTDSLISLFSNQIPGVALARGTGLIALDNIAVLKKLLARYARGFAGVIPDLVCGIPLASHGEAI